MLILKQKNKLRLLEIWNKPEKSATEVTLKLPSNMIGGSNDETNFPHKLLLTDRQVSMLRKVFVNNSSGNINLSKVSYLN